MSKLEINLFGAPEFKVDGAPLNLGRRKSEALLAYLAVTGHPQRRGKLAALLWPDASQSRAYTYLRRSLSALKQALDPNRLCTNHETVELSNTELHLDVAEFRSLLAIAAAQQHDAIEEISRLLRAAVTLHRGDFMAGFTLPDCPEFDEWQFFQRTEAGQDLFRALDELTGIYVASGEFEEAIPFVRDQLTLDPYDEGAHRSLMRLYARTDQWAAARRQFDTCVHLLATELDVEPADETVQLHQVIITKTLPPPAPVEQLTPTPDEDTNQSELPASLTPLIGRERELAALSILLTDPDTRLITLLGPGGIGKSRLALAVADCHADHFNHGAAFIALAALENPEQLSSAIILALGLTQAADVPPEQQLIDYLRNRNQLLVLDNFEHLLTAAPTVVELLQAASGVTVLTTSRARLNVQEEHLYALDGLPLPDLHESEETISAADSVRLFVHQACRQRHDFRLTAENLPAVNRICHLVQGMPLGILLAAGWVGVLTSRDIADRIAQSLDFLESDLQDLPDRQRSLRAVFASTWTMLSENERKIYPRLSVFRGGWTEVAGESIAHLSIRDLKGLLNKSLVQRSGPDRYVIHELLRQYAAESLANDQADETATRERHATFFIDFLSEKAPMLHSPHHLATLAQIGVERENLRVAWRWAAEQGRLDLLARAVDGLCLFYQTRGYTADGIVACQLAIDGVATLSDDSTRRIEALELTARLLMWQGLFHSERGNETALLIWDRAEKILESPQVAEWDTRRTRADLAHYRGVTALRLSDYDEADALCTIGETLYRELDEQWSLGHLLVVRATIYWHRNRYDQCRDLCIEALEILKGVGDDTGVSRSLMTLGLAASSQGRFDEADGYLRQCVALAEESSGDRISVATARNMLGWNLMYTGEFSGASTLSLDSAAIADELGNRYWASLYRWASGAALLHAGEYAYAEEVLTKGLALAQESDTVRNEAAMQMLLSSVALVDGDLECAQNWAEAGVETYRTIDHADELARVLAVLCTVLLLQGRTEEAKPLLLESIRDCDRTGVALSMIAVLPAATLYLASNGDLITALTCQAVAMQQLILARSRWYADVYWRRLEQLTANVPVAQRVAAQAQAQRMTLSQAIADLLVRLSDQGVTV